MYYIPMLDNTTNKVEEMQSVVFHDSAKEHPY